MKVKIDVGEPREFDAGDGTSVLTGTLIDELSGEQVIETGPKLATQLQATGGKGDTLDREAYKEFWFVVETPRVDIEGMRFSSLLMTPRYRLKKPPAELLGKGRELVVNAIWRRDGEKWDARSIDQAREGAIEVEGVIIARVMKTEE